MMTVSEAAAVMFDLDCVCLATDNDVVHNCSRSSISLQVDESSFAEFGFREGVVEHLAGTFSSASCQPSTGSHKRG